MARGQLRAIGSVTVWMIVFVALWLTSTVFLVILYTGREELADENTRLKDDNLRLISQPERDSVELLKHAKKEGPTVVGLLEGARSETARLATGNPADDPAVVRSTLDEFLLRIRSDRIIPQPQRYEDISYDEALNMLYEAFNAVHEQMAAGSDRVAQLEAEVDRLVQANTQLRSDFDRRTRELGDQLAEVETDRAEKLREREEALARLQREFEDRRQENVADLTEERQRVSALKEQVAQLQERLAAYRGKFDELMIGPEELSTARQPDGQVLTAIPGDNVVYINLGRKDSLTLGLQFAVYSAETGIPADGRAKARIEVVSISEESAECKIVHVVGHDLILEGDLIANPIYDRNRPLSFLVVGEFDMDHDGSPDSDGAATVESLITDWGGTLSTELTALTDFVVLGGAPPRSRSGRDVSPEQLERVKAERQVYDRYMETVASAKSLSVPIMTQEVFLNFLGYMSR